jgi:Holliday junction resolvasome RuvABC DNA-binding subunit
VFEKIKAEAKAEVEAKAKADSEAMARRAFKNKLPSETPQDVVATLTRLGFPKPIIQAAFSEYLGKSSKQKKM